MMIKFDTNGNDKQREVAKLWFDTTTTEVLYGGSKGSGKSFLGCSLIVADALVYPGTFYFIARKTLVDLIRYTVPSLHEVFAAYQLDSNYHKFNGQYNFFEFYNNSRIYLIDAKYVPSDPHYERFGSMQMTRGWIEEAGEFNRECKAALGASIGRWKNDLYKLKGKLLMTCNPSNNFLLQDYYRPAKKNELPDWRKFISALPADNKRLPSGYIDHLLQTLTTNQIARLVYGEWEYDDDPALLVDYDAVLDMFTNDFVEEKGENFISTDLAGKGRDKWVVGQWKGLVCRIPIVQGFSEGKEMEEKLHRLSQSTSTPRSNIVADSDGLGFFLESYLKGIKEFHGGQSANDKGTYKNLKAECAYKLAELINKRMIRVICTPEQQELIVQEVMLLRAENTNAAEQKRAIISKDKMKELIGRSPDFLDMLIMRMLFEVKPKAKGASAAKGFINQKR